MTGGYKTKLLSKAGKLTGYAFACGYTLSKDWDDENSITLQGDMHHNCYFVVGFIDGEHVYEAFRFLNDARRYFNHWGE